MRNLTVIILTILLSSCVVERKLDDNQYHLWYSQKEFKNATSEKYALERNYVVPYTYATRDYKYCHCDQFEDAIYIGVGYKYKTVHRNVLIRYKGKWHSLMPGITKLDIYE